MLPAQHQTTDKVSNQLVNKVEYLAAKEPDIFPQELVETKGKKNGLKESTLNNETCLVAENTTLNEMSARCVKRQLFARTFTITTLYNDSVNVVFTNCSTARKWPKKSINAAVK